MKTKAGNALVTGVSRGLGRALVVALVEEGWTVIGDGRTHEGLEDLRREVKDPERLVTVPGDITDADHRNELRRAAVNAGGLDLLINNAGILGPSPLPALLDLSVDDLARVFRHNAGAQLVLIQALRRELKEGATIVNITSDASREAYAGWGIYGASKAALDQFSAVLAVENPQWRVYAVDPGDMRTRMHQDAFPGEDISDRPLPEESVPGILAIVEQRPKSGRYRACDFQPAGVTS